MATPRILLSSANSPDVNNWIPPSYAQDHAKLVCAAKELFIQEFSGDDWDVHFHLAALDIGATTCTARLVPHFWNRGDYFTHEFTMTDELYLYAHFEPKVGADSGCPTFVQPAMDPVSFEAGIEMMGMQQNGESESLGPYFEGGPVQPLDLSFWNPVLTDMEVGKPQSELEKILKENSKSKAGSESGPESEPVRRRTRSSKPRYTTPIRDPTRYPTLPTSATPENYTKDRQMAMIDNTKDEFLTSGRTLESLSSNRVLSIARARLIAGKYGVIARKPCDSCKTRNKICRIFHPIMLTEAWHAAKRYTRKDSRCACCSNDCKPSCNAE
ncbi:hypothetical protein P171DRAFT_480151 [Karstenula rhodostoma CBS 690.94]|uniref:Uncharacterized protein n=1 Tax=Karstenula rhodostoma CBS 690.94 TaxID=1392251 RepID=A0A9P4UIE3_9PLEO|nr:hypothetical protein P171DRAFT_480151 [Karstenula rhodostoma CBS 690.94]